MDAPVTGEVKRAKNGTLTVMVGGHRADFEDTRRALAPVGECVYACRAAREGQITLGPSGVTRYFNGSATLLKRETHDSARVRPQVFASSSVVRLTRPQREPSMLADR